MNKLVETARKITPNFDNLTTQQQYDLLKRIEPGITPEDLVYFYEQRHYVEVDDEAWRYYLENYMK